MYDVIIAGAGFAGATAANRLAEKGKKVLLVDKRDHIGGNAYDLQKDGILVHQYGPHIFHTSNKVVFDYLSRFTSWYPYEHRVLGHIQDKIVPIPFNLSSVESCFDNEKADHLKEVLVKEYGEGKKVPIMDLLKNEDPEIRELADFIFENVFKYYTMKQWGLSAEQIDGAVTARVPVNVSYDDRYFNDPYQFMPVDGYTKIFEKMLDHENIEVRLSTNIKSLISLKDGKIFFEGEEFGGKFIYTGILDELFDYSLGELPYRSLYLDLQKKDETFQKAATENYPCDEKIRAYTRITEYKHFLPEEEDGISYIHIEYPMAYNKDGERGNVPYYPIFTDENQQMYERYAAKAKEYPDLILLGRLAEYKYYNMDAIVLKALETVEEL